MREKPLNGKKILVVDDEELLREILMEDLNAYGAETVGAMNGTEAFEIIQHQDFDAVITDIRMPGGNGLSLIKNINSYFQENRPHVFVCSGYNDVTLSDTDMQVISYMFDKPFDRETFLKTMTVYLTKPN